MIRHQSVLRSLRTFFVVALSLTAVSGCQFLFDDYTVEEAPPPLPRVCPSRAYRCSGAHLERCSDDRSGWQLVQPCASEGECNLSSESCRPCVLNELQCNGAQLLRCNAAAGWDLVEGCGSAELCQESKALGNTACLPPVCDAGSVRCHKAELLRCGEGRDRFESAGICETPALCVQTVTNNPQAERCDPPACQPDEHSCEGNLLRRCNADRTGWDTVLDCGSASSCSASARACQPCTAGATECNHGDLRTCEASGEWRVTQTCDTPALCDPTTLSCRTSACATVGERRCLDVGGVSELQECGPTKDWVLLDTCPTAALCDPEQRKCEARGCRLGEVRCSGDTLQACNGDRTTFVTIQQCEPGGCSPLGTGSCNAATCSSGSLRCNNLHFEECVDGVWQHRERCLTQELCNPGPVDPGCRKPVCGGVLGQFRCQSMDLNVCADGRHDWEYVRGCRSQTDCDPGPAIPNGSTPDAVFGFGSGICRRCEPGATSCQGNSLYVCPGPVVGGDLVKIADCAGGCVPDGAGARCGP
jgi:hypothetical protein